MELFTFLVDPERIFQDSSNIQPRIYQHVFPNIIYSWWTYDKIYDTISFWDIDSHRAVDKIFENSHPPRKALLFWYIPVIRFW